MQELNSSIKYEVNRYQSQELKSSFFQLWEDLNNLVGPIGSNQKQRYAALYTDQTCREIFCYIDFKSNLIELGVCRNFVEEMPWNTITFGQFPDWNRSKEFVGTYLNIVSSIPELTAVLCCCCEMRRGSYELDTERYLFKAQESHLLRVVSYDLETEDIERGMEGKPKLTFYTYHERNPKLRAQAIRIHGTTCMACGFNYEKTYGSIGKNFIEVHHLNPLSNFQDTTSVDPKTDMVVVCSNCHRMIHRNRQNILSLNELREMIKLSEK